MRTPVILIVALIWAKSNYTHAQTSYFYGAYFETSLFNVKSKQMDSYLSTFNLINQSNLTQEFGGFKPTGAFNWGIEITTWGIHMGAKFNRFSSSTEAKFTDGSSRLLELTQKSWIVPVGFSIYAGEEALRYNIGMSLGLGIQNTQLSSIKIYPDGTRSLGYDDHLNGIYMSQTAICVPEITFGVGRVIYLYASAGYQFSFWPFALKDENKFDMDAPGSYFGVDPLNQFEGDFNPNFGGFRFNFGLKINLLELLVRLD